MAPRDVQIHRVINPFKFCFKTLCWGFSQVCTSDVVAWWLVCWFQRVGPPAKVRSVYDFGSCHSPTGVLGLKRHLLLFLLTEYPKYRRSRGTRAGRGESQREGYAEGWRGCGQVAAVLDRGWKDPILPSWLSNSGS